MDTRFTKEEFYQQVGEFRKLMQDKTFMESPEEKREIAVSALQFCYMHLALDTPKEDVDSCAMMLKATIHEYARRLSFIQFRPLRGL